MPLDLKRIERIGGPGSSDLKDFLRDLAVAVADLQTAHDTHEHTALDTAPTVLTTVDAPTTTG